MEVDPLSEPQVFISYKSEELDTAMWMRSVLETNGISCWMAPDNIPGGSSYAAEIPRAIRGCKVFVVILSEKTQESMWVPKELDQAINAHKIVMPFMIEDCVLKDDFNFYLSNVHRYAAYENKVRAAEKMVTDIRALLEIADPQNAGTETEEPDAPSVPEPPKTVVREEKKPKPKKTSKPVPKRRAALWAGLAALVLLLCAGLGILLSRGSSEKTKTDGSTIRVTLTAPDDMSVKSFNEALPVLTERLDALTGGEKYKMDVRDDTIELELPSSAFGDLDPSRVLRCYVTRPLRFYGLNRDSWDYVALSREDLESVERLHGTLDGADLKDLSMDASEYDYFRIVFTEDCIKENGDAFVDWGNDFYLGQDMEGDYGDFYSFKLFPGEDSRTYYLIDDFQAGHIQDVLEYNLTHPAMADGFLITVDMQTQADWQRGEDMIGQNQCDPDDIKDASVCFSLENGGGLTKGERVDNYNTLCARLDAFGCPYAIGDRDKGDDGFLFFIKLPLDHVSPAVMDLLASNGSMSLETKSAYMGFGYDDEISVEETADGEKELRIHVSESNLPVLQALTGFAENEDGRLYLTLGSERLLAVEAEEVSQDGTLVVRDYCSVENGEMKLLPLGKDFAWVMDVLDVVLNGPDLETYLSPKDYQFYPGQDGEVPTDADFFQKQDYDFSDLQKKIEALGKGIETRVTGKGILRVMLHLKVDESLPETFTSLSEQIYELADLQHSLVDSISIYAIDEYEDPMERCRMFFQFFENSLYAGDEQLEDGYIYVYGIFTGGRLEPLKDAFKQIVDVSPFYTGFRETEYSSGRWTYESN